MVETSMALRCDAVAWVGDDFPGWIKVRLVDADGVERVFVDKVPIFTEADLPASTRFPIPVRVRCAVLRRDDGGQVLVVSTAPDGLATEDGRAEFRVRPDQLERHAVYEGGGVTDRWATSTSMPAA